jgi:hypothetical protein
LALERALNWLWEQSDQFIEIDLRKADPQKPGHKVGHAGSCPLVPEVSDEEIVVPLMACPQFGLTVGKWRAVVEYIEQLPVLRPRMLRASPNRPLNACGYGLRLGHGINR